MESMVVSDLDGTLFSSDCRVSRTNMDTLKRLGEDKIFRIIATGRSLYSAMKVLPEDFPIDFLIFSSGAGCIEWKTKEILFRHSLGREKILEIFQLLTEYNMDFMIHDPVPDNHWFYHFHSGGINPDFWRRVEVYKPFSRKGDPESFRLNEACQFLAVFPAGSEENCITLIQAALSGCNVIRTTSPLDGESLWVEIFPFHVSKSAAAGYLAEVFHIDPAGILTVGNDYNDVQLLSWGSPGIVVDNAPESLKSQFTAVSSNDNDGFTEAVLYWESLR